MKNNTNKNYIKYCESLIFEADLSFINDSQEKKTLLLVS